MTILVFDSNAALKVVLPEPHSDKAKQLRDDYHNALIELIAPDIFPIETLHGLTKAERQKRISFGHAYSLWQTILADSPVLHAHTYEIAAAARIGIYDCIYVALAERENCALATADDKLINALQKTFPFIRHLSTFP